MDSLCAAFVYSSVQKAAYYGALYTIMCVCVCGRVCVCCVFTVYKGGRDKRMRSEAKGNGGEGGRERATAGTPSCPGWFRSHSERPPAPRRVRPAHLPHG